MLIKLLTPASDDTKLVTPFIDLEGFNAKTVKVGKRTTKRLAEDRIFSTLF